MSVEVELRRKREGTRAFIDRNPDRKIIVLSREDLVFSGGSYVRQNQRTVEDQMFIFAGSGRQLPERRTIDGQALTPEYILIGYYGADLRRGDWFYIDGVKYEIVFVQPETLTYETKAEVAYRG